MKNLFQQERIMQIMSLVNNFLSVGPYLMNWPHNVK